MAGTTIETFVDDDGGVEGVALMMREASIIESDGELVPGCKLSVDQARKLMYSLQVHIAAIENA